MLRREPDRFTKAYHLVFTALLLHILGQTGSFVHAHSSYHATATYNVKDYGATGAAHNVTDGVMYAGSRQLTSATATFSSANVGSPIYCTRSKHRKHFWDRYCARRAAKYHNCRCRRLAHRDSRRYSEKFSITRLCDMGTGRHQCTFGFGWL
jgi:hypothetical protein